MVIIYKTQADLTDEIILNLIDNGTITDFNIGAINRIIIDGINYSISIDGDDESLYNQLQILDESRNIDTSTGYYLEQLGLLVGITRDEGNTSSGYVTFSVNSDLSDTLTITSGSRVATSPNDPDGQKIFEVSENTTFNKSVSGEVVLFTDGVYRYRLDARFFETITDIETTRSSSVVVLIEDTDFSIETYDNYIHKIDADNPHKVLDNFNATTGWTSNDSAGVSADTSNQKQGTGCLNIGKAQTSDAFVHISKTITAVDIESLTPSLWVYIDDTAELNKLDNIRVYLGNTSTTNSRQYKVDRTALSVGWNQLFLVNLEATNGVFDETDVDYVRIRFNYLNGSSTTTLGDLKVDFLIVSEVEDFTGNVIEIVEANKPDDDEDITIEYNPRSVEVLCESEEVGEIQNVSSDKIIAKITANTVMNTIDSVNNYDFFSGGTDEESDDELRENIKGAAQAPGSASAFAMKNAIENLSYVRGALVIDRPEIDITDEPHVYITGKTNYRLQVQTPFLDDEITPTNILITDTFGGTADYTYGTDYELDGTDIVWLGATTPTNGDVFFISYSADELCKGNILVSGITSITSTQSDEIDELIDDVKPIGVKITWSEPTEVSIDVTATVTLDTDYTLTDELTEEIETAISSYINSLSIGDDVILSKIISTIVSIEGVADTSVSAPASNTTIDTDEIAVVGTITIS